MTRQLLVFSARLFAALCLLIVVWPAKRALAGDWHVARRVVLGGDGGWDFLTLDAAGHRLFIVRSDRVTVVDTDTDHAIGEIPGLHKGHGVALASQTGHGFVTSGGDGTVTMFDATSLKALGMTPAADDADSIIYDPASSQVVTFNGDGNSATAVDPATGKAIRTVPLGGKPDVGVSAGNGKLYVNIQDKSEVAELDAKSLAVTRRWPIAPCESPSALAIDEAHHRLFSVCRNKLMGVSDADAGHLLTTVPIGEKVDGAAYDPSTGDAFASNGEGTLTVVHEDTPDTFHVVSTVTTMPGARTMALAPKGDRIYTVSAEFGPAPAEPTPDNPRRRPPVLPGTFTLLVLER